MVMEDNDDWVKMGLLCLVTLEELDEGKGQGRLARHSRGTRRSIGLNGPIGNDWWVSR